MDSLTFKNGDKMPLLGLGTWKSAPMDAYQAVLTAIKAGYRHIDCAHVYKNEKEIGEAFGEAFRKGWVKREELWVTSKLWNDCHEKHRVLPALKRTLNHLQLDYLDMYLVHWPVAVKYGVDYASSKEDFLDEKDAPLSETWAAMEEAYESGLAKHIGVSNFNRKKLTEILSMANIHPEMNQVEMHPFLPQNELLNFCREKGIGITAYAPLGSAYRVDNKEVDHPILLENGIVRSIAEKHQATPAQIVIKWGMDRGTPVIPKSVKELRILENFASAQLRLDKDDTEQLNSLEGPFRYTTGIGWTRNGSPYSQSDLWD